MVKKCYIFSIILLFGVVTVLYLKLFNCYTKETLPNSIELAVNSLINIQKKNGSFKYEIDFITGKYSKNNGIVRQAGVGYALGEYYVHSKNKSVKKSLRKAIEWYKNQSVSYKDGLLVAYKGKMSNAKVGATALALLAELQYAEVSGDDQFSDVRNEWLKGIFSLYKEGEGFCSSPVKEEESSYFNGEVWLALSSYHTFNPEDKRVEILLEKLDTYFMSHYSKKLDKSFFHWGLISASKRHETTKDPIFLEFGIQQSRLYFEHRPEVVDNLNSCYFVEGIASLIIQMKTSGVYGDFRKLLEERLEEEMIKNKSFQITSDTIKMGRTELKSSIIERYKGAFRNGLYRPQSRIDFTQHCLSAMIKEEIIEKLR